MKKTLTSLAVLASLGASSAAMAQSNVTLWGVLDLDLTHISAGRAGSATGMSKGGNQGDNKLGFKGVEDIGGGNWAAFYLENGFNAQNGTMDSNGVLFNRRATVSLGGTWGEIRLGRDFNETFENFVLGDPFGDASIAANADGFQYSNSGINPATQYFVNNAIKYAYGYEKNDSTWGFGANGLYAEAQYAFANNKSGTPATGQYFGVRAGYGVGPFNGAIALAQSTGIGQVSGNTGVKFNEFNVAARYDLGVATLIGSGGTNSSGDANTKFTHITLGASIPVGNGSIPLAWSTTKQNGVGGTTANLFGIGYNYTLSKRTTIYGRLAMLKNGSNASYVPGDNGLISAGVAGQSSNAFQVGISHGF